MGVKVEVKRGVKVEVKRGVKVEVKRDITTYYHLYYLYYRLLHIFKRHIMNMLMRTLSVLMLN